MNPFEKRATEYIRDDLAFLPYVTPEPLLTHLLRPAKDDVLFEKLAVLVGSPGSGKTTLARLFLLPTITTLLKSGTQWKPLTDALTQCKALENGTTPNVAGCRIPLESDYRECWELPYEESIRQNLLFSLIQARAVLAWFRGLEHAGYDLASVTLIPRADASASLEAIGGSSLTSIREVARSVERDVYQITAGLVPPPADKLPSGATAAYQPFDVIEWFEVDFGGQRRRLKPLVICDDAHVLHPKQLDGVIVWLRRREIRVARWVLTRIDALRPHEVLCPSLDLLGDETTQGFNRSRELVMIWMQQRDANQRRNFRKIAKDMAEKYLRQMPVFQRRSLSSLEDLLDVSPPEIAAGKLKDLEESLKKGRKKFVGADRRAEIEKVVDDYLAGDEKRSRIAQPPEVRAAMVGVLLERYMVRVPQSSLFEDTTEAVPSRPLNADAGIKNAAEMQLHHAFDRPFFYGFEVLCDAASENAERFLRLAGQLVAQLETQLIRDSSIRLSPQVQERLLKERAARMISEEDIPDKARLLQLCEAIANECIERTMEPNATLEEGPNAWGILQEDFDTIPASHPELARVLQHGVAYNMFSLVRDYSTKNQTWCLVELGGTWSLTKGLTLKRGQFLERKVQNLVAACIRPETSA